jgi:cytochrome c oxidase cbb3-type subunit III
MRTRITASVALCSFFLLAACEPPGKPKAEEAQAENREAILDFNTLFRSNCAGCHGVDGKNGPARIINDPVYVSIIPRDALRDVIANGRPGTAMPAWAKNQGGPLTDKQVDALVDGIYKNWGTGGAPAGAPAYADSNKGDANHGKQLFARGCFMCHGPGAAVGSVTQPAYLELVSNQMLRTSIIVGRSDLGMPNYRFLNMGKPLSDQDVTDLVAYIDSLRTLPAPGTQGAPGQQQPGSSGARPNENGPGTGEITKGNEGSGHGPGSPTRSEAGAVSAKSTTSQRGVQHDSSR